MRVRTESENEDFRDDIESMNLKDVLPNIRRHRSLANELGNKKLVNLFWRSGKEVWKSEKGAQKCDWK